MFKRAFVLLYLALAMTNITHSLKYFFEYQVTHTNFLFPFQDLICSPADILEPRKKGTVRVAISVSELLRFHQPKDPK